MDCNDVATPTTAHSSLAGAPTSTQHAEVTYFNENQPLAEPSVVATLGLPHPATVCVNLQFKMHLTQLTTSSQHPCLPPPPTPPLALQFSKSFKLEVMRGNRFFAELRRKDGRPQRQSAEPSAEPSAGMGGASPTFLYVGAPADNVLPPSLLAHITGRGRFAFNQSQPVQVGNFTAPAAPLDWTPSPTPAPPPPTR